MSERTKDRWAALVTGACAHLLFVAAVASMAWALASGLQSGRGALHGGAALAVNLLLVFQFPLLHSVLLSARGRHLLPRVRAGAHGKKLDLTVYAGLASLQLLLAFWCWSPTGIVWHQPHGVGGGLQWAGFAAAWLFLVKALSDAGLAVQTGAAGWWALWRDRPVQYGGMPTAGLFRVCRQPIYLGFFLVMWTAPVWTPDLLLLGTGWGLYCLFGPLHKEARWSARYAAEFAAYQQTVPYMLPRTKR